MHINRATLFSSIGVGEFSMSRTLTTHHDGLGLNDLVIIHCDERDPDAGNASHQYGFWMDLEPRPQLVGQLQFQHGPRSAGTSIPGLLDPAVLAVLIDRYEGFQTSQYACPENDEVLGHLRAALGAMTARANRRAHAGTLGTTAPDEAPQP